MSHVSTDIPVLVANHHHHHGHDDDSMMKWFTYHLTMGPRPPSSKNYNFFEGMSEEEIIDYQISSIIGHRPTWKSGTNPQAN